MEKLKITKKLNIFIIIKKQGVKNDQNPTTKIHRPNNGNMA